MYFVFRSGSYCRTQSAPTSSLPTSLVHQCPIKWHEQKRASATRHTVCAISRQCNAHTMILFQTDGDPVPLESGIYDSSTIISRHISHETTFNTSNRFTSRSKATKLDEVFVIHLLLQPAAQAMAKKAPQVALGPARR